MRPKTTPHSTQRKNVLLSINDSVRFTPQEKPVLILILLTYFMILLDSSIVFTSVPVMKADLGLSAAEMSWVQDAYTLAFGGALLLGAQLGEVWGRTRVFLGGLIVFAVASLIVGAASTAHVLRNATLTGCGRHTEGCRLCCISLVSQRCNLVSDRAGCEKCGRLCSQGRAERSSPP